jgi:hypothetical protein
LLGSGGAVNFEPLPGQERLAGRVAAGDDAS